jgi:hypothetical protein
MKNILLMLILAPSFALACTDFTGTYNLGPTEGFNNWLKVQQTACNGMVLTICSGKTTRPMPGDCNPPGAPISFDGTTAGPGGAVYRIDQANLVEQSTAGKTIAIGADKHGLCSTKVVTWSLDGSHNLTMSESAVYNCEDGFQGTNTDAYTVLE